MWLQPRVLDLQIQNFDERSRTNLGQAPEKVTCKLYVALARMCLQAVIEILDLQFEDSSHLGWKWHAAQRGRSYLLRCIQPQGMSYSPFSIFNLCSYTCCPGCSWDEYTVSSLKPVCVFLSVKNRGFCPLLFPSSMLLLLCERLITSRCIRRTLYAMEILWWQSVAKRNFLALEKSVWCFFSVFVLCVECAWFTLWFCTLCGLVFCPCSSSGTNLSVVITDYLVHVY